MKSEQTLLSILYGFLLLWSVCNVVPAIPLPPLYLAFYILSFCITLILIIYGFIVLRKSRKAQKTCLGCSLLDLLGYTIFAGLLMSSIHHERLAIQVSGNGIIKMAIVMVWTMGIYDDRFEIEPMDFRSFRDMALEEPLPAYVKEESPPGYIDRI
jgi:hypothetical protein